MKYILGLGVGLIVLLIIKYFIAKNSKEKTLYRIRSQYGQVPDLDMRRDDLKLFNESCLRHDIDKITWNDLEMDKVFKRINICNSYVGEQILYDRLHMINLDNNEHEKMEENIRFFDENQTEREKVQVDLEKIGKQSSSYFLPYFIKNIDNYHLGNIWLYRIMSTILLGTVMLGLFLNEAFFFVAGFIFLINAGLYTFGKHKFEMHLGMLSSVVDLVSTANKFMKNYQLNEDDLSSTTKQSIEAMGKVVNRIVYIKRKTESSMTGDIGALIFDYLIGSSLWDFHVYYRIINLLKIHRDDFMNLYSYIGRIDSSICIASYRKSLPHYCLPNYNEESKIDFVDMYHPLIKDPVCNDVNMQSSYIITGSNASGKSTYIKAVAINMILAQSINLVLAKKASLPRAEVMTSMAVRDDLTSGESYYMMEINYLKRIVKKVNDDKMTLCIVDEILRGTNTEERIAASVAILNYIHQKNCLTIVASHDIKISEMLQDKYENCHFSEMMEEDDVKFDYKVKMGVSNSKNAIKLLDHIGFPKEIVIHAQELVLQI